MGNIKTGHKNKKNMQKTPSIKFEKIVMSKDNDCLKKLCEYCLLHCKKHIKSADTRNLIGNIRINNNILYHN